MLPEILLAIIFLWDGYFFINYLLSLLKLYKTRRWAPFVSILIPAYNEGETIAESIKSALSQDYPDFEVIVVDDGSEDDTFEKATSLKDPRLRVFKKTHEGKARALNFGLSKAKGEIIVTTDADSVLSSNALKSLVERFYSPEVVGVGGQVRVLGGSFLERAQDVEHLRIAMFRRAKELEDLSVAPGPLSAFRREALELIGGFVESEVEDYATTKELKKIGKILYAPGARVYTIMPKTLPELWRQRKRWFLGDLKHLGGGLEKELFFLILGDFIALLDVVVPVLLLLNGNLDLLLLFLSYEMLTLFIPTVVEGGSLLNAFLFPVFLWFWALFYLFLHIYGYLRMLLGILNRKI
ncbi:Dolichol-phosphate mannosyltransferase in lipid-linked oligosaccharide synthesis cluster [Thermococcus sp. 2319x1]|uniref:glycosyltransferase n=1 Tax=Thermococcus sp. 2319x1 TaxID=1674923 RepID=UPI00073A64F0|nr:glycosyltransferase [Thermococcus sp. 2319x1]ALV61710.1 Dolichol-phosphate mannosyltransferase in lipid-linked oligosaccharide synthesis cluster [Thermococcus sp. 2319x1]